MIYLDIETLDFFQDAHIKVLPRDQQLQAMRFGCAVTAVDYDEGDIWEWAEWTECGPLRSALYIAQKQTIVGWNIDDFDLPVINHNANRIEYPWPHWEPKTVDLFALIRQFTGRWYSLETVAQHNLGRGKLADGQRAAEWLRSGDPEQIAKAFEYCRYDVQLTIDLHQMLLRGEPLRLPPRAKREELNEVLWWLDGRTERLPDAMGVVSTR